jgi:hypothetical protein
VDETCFHEHKVSQTEMGYAITDWFVRRLPEFCNNLFN